MSVGAEPYLRGDLTEVLSEERLLQWAETAQGEVFREVAGRRTLRVLLDGKHYFLKFHAGVG